VSDRHIIQILNMTGIPKSRLLRKLTAYVVLAISSVSAATPKYFLPSATARLFRGAGDSLRRVATALTPLAVRTATTQAAEINLILVEDERQIVEHGKFVGPT